MSQLFFIALTILGSGSYQEHSTTVGYFNAFQEQYGLEIRGEAHGVRVACNMTYEICFASDGEQIIVMQKTYKL